MIRIIVLALVALGVDAGAREKDTLRAAVDGCDRLRVRSGGTCHRDVDDERTLFETEDREAIATLIEGIEIDPDTSGLHCMCCGSPTFEFYRGKKQVAMLGFHHGRSLRWHEGPWAGDGALTDRSAGFLCRWLAERGVEGPLAEREEAQARQKALSSREQRYREILPGTAAATSAHALQQALRARGLDPVERTVTLFRLFGCHDGSWTSYAGPDSVVEDLLDETTPETLGKALGRLGEDGWALTGAARWLFECGKEEQPPAAAIQAALPALAAHAFAHPRQECRHSAMMGVRRVGGEAAVTELTRVLAGETEPRPLPEADRVDAGGMVVFRGRGKDRRKTSDDRVLAAWLLARMGNQESIPGIQALREQVDGEDRKILEEALELLEAN